MKMTVPAAFFAGAVLISLCILNARCAIPVCAAIPPDVGLKSKHQHTQRSGDLIEVLGFIANTFSVPMVIEVAQPYPVDLSIPAGTDSAAQLIEALIAKCRGYDWRDDGGVVVVTKSSLMASPGDFMNRRLPVFVMPADVAYLRLQLAGALAAPPGVAPLITGITPPDLTALKLPQGRVLKGFTGREILITAAKENREIFSLIIFPNGNPKTQKDRSEATGSWYIRSISSLSSTPLRVRSMPAKQH